MILFPTILTITLTLDSLKSVYHVYICVCLCLCVCIYMYIYICVCVCVCVCVSVCVRCICIITLALAVLPSVPLLISSFLVGSGQRQPVGPSLLMARTSMMLAWCRSVKHLVLFHKTLFCFMTPLATISRFRLYVYSCLYTLTQKCAHNVFKYTMLSPFLSLFFLSFLFLFSFSMRVLILFCNFAVWKHGER